MPARRRSVLWIALLLAVAGSAFLLLRAGGSVDPVPQPAPAQAGPATEPPSQPPEQRVASAPAANPGCEAQRFEVTRENRAETVCVGVTAADQDGSIRKYRVESQSGTPRWLEIEAVGNLVLSAALGSGTRSEFSCREEKCRGISIGRPDVQGVRTISLQDTLLAANDSTTALISAQLRTAQEEQTASYCAGQGVSIITSDSSSMAFCPGGGAGFEIGTEGKSYRFQNLDGESIRVAVDEREQVRRIEFRGESTLACASAECAGARISQENEKGERTFTFAGTTLTETSKADISAVMNGTLILPAL